MDRHFRLRFTMRGFPMRGPRRLHKLIRVAALIGVVACGDPYLHTNPYDPVYPVEFAISGPDTLFSLGEIGQYTVQNQPTVA